MIGGKLSIFAADRPLLLLVDDWRHNRRQIQSAASNYQLCRRLCRYSSKFSIVDDWRHNRRHTICFGKNFGEIFDFRIWQHRSAAKFAARHVPPRGTFSTTQRKRNYLTHKNTLLNIQKQTRTPMNTPRPIGVKSK